MGRRVEIGGNHFLLEVLAQCGQSPPSPALRSVELLVVIGIIALLISISPGPALSKAKGSQPRRGHACSKPCRPKLGNVHCDVCRGETEDISFSPAIIGDWMEPPRAAKRVIAVLDSWGDYSGRQQVSCPTRPRVANAPRPVKAKTGALLPFGPGRKFGPPTPAFPAGCPISRNRTARAPRAAQ